MEASAAVGQARTVVVRESHLRTWVRSFTWRVSGVVLSVGLVLLFGGSLRLGVELGVSYNVVRFVLFYLHERWWHRSSWGLVTR